MRPRRPKVAKLLSSSEARLLHQLLLSVSLNILFCGIFSSEAQELHTRQINLLLLLYRRSTSPWNWNKGCFCQSDVGALYSPASRGPCDGVTRWPFVSCNVSVSTQIISYWWWMDFQIVSVCVFGEIVRGTMPVKFAASLPLHLYFSGWEAFLCSWKTSGCG